MQYPSAPVLTLLVLLPLIVWRMYRRFRRMVGKQRLSKIRPRITLTVFPLLVILLAVTAFPHPVRLAWLAAGLVAGGLLGIWGLRKTVFEATPEGFFYTPYAHLGIALSSLFIARIVYRFVEILLLDPNVPHGMEDFSQSSLTLSVFGLLAGYYIVYAIGLARWRARVIAAKQRRESELQKA